MLYYAMLCYAMLYCTILDNAILYHAILPCCPDKVLQGPALLDPPIAMAMNPKAINGLQSRVEAESANYPKKFKVPKYGVCMAFWIGHRKYRFG